MGGKKIRSGAGRTGSGRISSEGSTPKDSMVVGNTDGETVVLRFQYVDDGKYGLQTLNQEDLKLLTSFFKRLEKTTWLDVKKTGSKDQKYKVGFGFTPLTPNKPLPEEVSKDVDVSEMRFGEKQRVWGFRQGRFYFLLWYDPEHEISEK